MSRFDQQIQENMLNTVNTSELEEQFKSMDLEKLATDIYRVKQANGDSVLIEVLGIDLNLKTMTIRQHHVVYDLVFKDNLDLVLDKMGIKRAVDTISTDIKAPMPGKVISILVKAGDEVTKGDPILILEAMKMENVLKADRDCVIKAVLIQTGINVEKAQLLVELA